MSETRINNRKDILLLLLYSPGLGDSINQPIIGRTRLVKMLFLFNEEVLPHFRKDTEIDENNFYDFFAWDFGPFSREVYDDITFFMLRDFIKSKTTGNESLSESAAEWEEWISTSGVENEPFEIREYEEEEFSLTDIGLQFTSKLYKGLSESQKRLLKEFKARTSTVPLRGLLRYVYKKYPEMTAKSKIKDSLF